MWVFTQGGFVSAVADSANKNQLIVRARDRASLESLAALGPDQIIVGAGSDYPYRIICDRLTFAEWLSSSASAIDYANFKDQVHMTRGEDYSEALMAVWVAMLEVTDEEGRGVW